MQTRIVIVGGGAGGLELACKLGRKLGAEQVTLVDRQLFHIWKPSLHEVAAGTLDIHQEGLSYMILARRNHFSFTLGDLSGFDAANKRITLAELPELARRVADLPHLRLRGLMTVPAPTDDFLEQRQAFHALRTAYEQLNAAGFSLDTLSMGMTHDLEAAIAEGATLVRGGTAIFGERTTA